MSKLQLERSKTRALLICLVAGAMLAAGCTSPAPDQVTNQATDQVDIAALSGPYLGQPAPGAEPRPFAPGVVATNMYTRDIAITPDGNEIYFGIVLGNYDYATIAMVSQVDGVWTGPTIAPFATDPRYWHIEPAISPDGQRFFFVSNRPPTGDGPPLEHQDIWVMERDGGGWGAPSNLGAPVNSQLGEFFPSITEDGTLYFTRENRAAREDLIVRSRLVDGAYSEPEVLPAEVNSGRAQYNAFVDPQERYLIVPTAGREDTLGGTDYYIAFRNADDTWSGPINLGDMVNSPGNLEYSPYVSRDGKYFFFMATRRPSFVVGAAGELTFRGMLDAARTPGNDNPTIWWMDAGFLDGLRP